MSSLCPEQAGAFERVSRGRREKLNEYFLMIERGSFEVIEFYKNETGEHVRGRNPNGSSELELTIPYGYARRQFELRAGLDMPLREEQTGKFIYGPYSKPVSITICSKPNRFGEKDITISL